MNDCVKVIMGDGKISYTEGPVSGKVESSVDNKVLK